MEREGCKWGGFAASTKLPLRDCRAAVFIPQPDDGFREGMIVAENSQTRGIAVEAASFEGSKVDPARGQHAAEMAARKREDVARQRPHFGNEPIGAGGNLLHGLAAG